MTGDAFVLPSQPSCSTDCVRLVFFCWFSSAFLSSQLDTTTLHSPCLFGMFGKGVNVFFERPGGRDLKEGKISKNLKKSNKKRNS